MTTFFNCFPLCLSAFKVYTRKFFTIVERITADFSYAVGYSYGCKAATTLERPPADRSYAVGDGYACKTAATAERISANSFSIAS